VLRILLSTLAAATLLVALPAAAKEKSGDAAAHFLRPADYDVARLLPPPPPDDSDRTKGEIAELHHIADTVTPARDQQAHNDAETKDVSIFAEAMGAGFELKALPATAKLFDDIRDDEKIAAAAAKAYFKRNHPWILDPTLKTCSRGDPKESAYPSGHTTMGYAMGIVLASLAPDKAQAILARSASYAESRLICAAHYRSDTIGGQVLGTIVAERMMRNPAFKAEYAAAAKELAAAHLTAQ